MLKPCLLIIATLLLACSFSSFAQVNPDDVTIVRDKWGVPHIYGKTDADAAYGLGWAHSEDDFKHIQQIILIVNGKLGSVEGKKGAMLDFVYHIMGTHESIEERYDTSYSQKYKDYLQGYCDAVNKYAEMNPKEVYRKDIFPITQRDLMKSYMFTMAILTNVVIDVLKIFKDVLPINHLKLAEGSNAIAISPNLSDDGKAYLAINSHQPLEGLFSWYEVHMNSEEGLNMLGGTFPGGAGIFHGTNPNLGWAATLNHPDLTDVYLLTVKDSAGSKWHQYDDGWEKMKPRHKKVKVKVGFLKIPIKKKFWMSEYGPVMKSKGNYYALRYPVYHDIKVAEQLFSMIKAKNFEEWKSAIDLGHFAGINLVYADVDGNIFYISNGQFADRNPKYDWSKVLPGNTSETKWEPKFFPVEVVPQIKNPKSGYLFNTNNSPFNATSASDNLDSLAFNPIFGYNTKENNRSIRFKQLISEYNTLSYEEFKKIKYNRSLSQNAYSSTVENMEDAFRLDTLKYPHLTDALKIMNEWDRTFGPENEYASVFVMAMNKILEGIVERVEMYDVGRLTEAQFVEAVEFSQKFLKKKYGSLKVPLGDIQKHVRGNVELPIGGAADVLAANFSEKYSKKNYKMMVGESYIALVKYSKNGVEIETVNAYGASAKEGSPHYTDQMEMFVNQELKPMTLNKDEIFKQAKEIYHPK